MRTTSTVAEALPRSGIREIMERALPRPGVIRLEIGEPDFNTPQHIIDAAEQALADGYTRYLSNAGLMSLRELLAEKSTRISGVELTAQNLMVTVGGTQAIYLTFSALLNPGDEVLLPDPGWPNFAMAAMANYGTVVRYPLHLEHGFIPNPREVAERITSKTKILLINTPSNPTGAVIPRNELEELVALAQRHDLWVMLDEVYNELIFEGPYDSGLKLDPERTIAINSLSKTYSMTGWRLGYLVANPKLVTLISKVQESQVACVAGFVQRAGEAALVGPQDCVAEMRESYRERRDATNEVLKRHDLWRYQPNGAFYVMLDVSNSGLDGREFAFRLLDEENVAVAPGPTFGQLSNSQVRISMATKRSDLLEGVDRACRLIRKLASARGD